MTALRLDPDYAWPHINLAKILHGEGRVDEAEDHYRQVLRLDPDNLEALRGVRGFLVAKGRGEEARLGWGKALEANPASPDAWYGYAELCLFLGDQEEYCRARRALLDRFGATASPFIAEPVGRACLLLPVTGDELREAAELTDRAVAAKASTPEWIYRYFLFAKGLAEYRRGRLAAAISVMEGDAGKVMRPAPLLVTAMARHRLGHEAEARKTLAAAVLAFDAGGPPGGQPGCLDTARPFRPRGRGHDRSRPASGLPAGGPPARGTTTCTSGCAFGGVSVPGPPPRPAARPYADAFAADPKLAEDVKAETPLPPPPASRGCGWLRGRRRRWPDSAEPERARLQRLAQALKWLRLDLTAWMKRLEAAKPAERAEAQKALARWREEPDLAGLRDAQALDKLPPAERQECRALWSDLDAQLERVRASK